MGIFKVKKKKKNQLIQCDMILNFASTLPHTSRCRLEEKTARVRPEFRMQRIVLSYQKTHSVHHRRSSEFCYHPTSPFSTRQTND